MYLTLIQITDGTEDLSRVEGMVNLTQGRHYELVGGCIHDDFGVKQPLLVSPRPGESVCDYRLFINGLQKCSAYFVMRGLSTSPQIIPLHS
ncbi:hypothetical protein [Vibrio breoganii]|uniref:hypothetical protein n=1 Tax=Vibrio breoganii TaxID=553239 RepID=UPI000C82593B|nr:hypothetical protein [Vibrio breoganii]PML15844.1 hypothetical protein BCT84_07525 [Vibrio breoganii]